MVGVLIWVARPLAVFVCTLGSGLSGRERLFMAWICPRGVVAVAVAGLFRLLLDEAGVPAGSELQALVFVTVLVTVTLQRARPREFKTAVLDTIHRALVAAGVPETDRFQRVLELDADRFRFDARYPDVTTSRTADFVLIEILWSVGRSVKVRRKLLEELMGTLARNGLDTEKVMVVFKETTWENWAFGGGRLIHA